MGEEYLYKRVCHYSSQYEPTDGDGQPSKGLKPVTGGNRPPEKPLPSTRQRVQDSGLILSFSKDEKELYFCRE